MRWKLTIEGVDGLCEGRHASISVRKNFSELYEGGVGMSIGDGKNILALIQKFLIKQECELYVSSRRICPTCSRLRPIKDYSTRTMITVFGPVKVRTPRIGCCAKGSG